MQFSGFIVLAHLNIWGIRLENPYFCPSKRSVSQISDKAFFGLIKRNYQSRNSIDSGKTLRLAFVQSGGKPAVDLL
jgi:hypothetical protein